MVKKINIILLLALVVLLGFMNNNLNNDLASSETYDQSKYITFEYVITDIENGEYYGRSTKDNTGIYFTDENLQPDQVIEKGDKIQATFERDSRIDGIVSIHVKN